MKKLIYETMFDKMQKIGILDNTGHPAFKEYLKIENKPYMALALDRLTTEKEGTIRISMAHNYTQNGDLMADPDMEIRIYPGLKAVEALTYQQDGLGIYQQVYPEPGKVCPKLKKDLNIFLNGWLKNLIDQGFKANPPTTKTITPYMTDAQVTAYADECEANRIKYGIEVA
jgi:uncharacterized protein YqiB (DUF1249 family)